MVITIRKRKGKQSYGEDTMYEIVSNGRVLEKTKDLMTARHNANYYRLKAGKRLQPFRTLKKKK